MDNRWNSNHYCLTLFYYCKDFAGRKQLNRFKHRLRRLGQFCPRGPDRGVDVLAAAKPSNGRPAPQGRPSDSLEATIHKGLSSIYSIASCLGVLSGDLKQ